MATFLKIVTGTLEENCYIAYANGKGVVIDPGAEGDRIVHGITENQIQPRAILLTHGHFDHIGAVKQVQEHFHIPVYIHQKDAPMLEEPAKRNVLGFGSTEDLKADYCLEQNQVLDIDEDLSFQVLHTPGHTPGSCTFRWEDILFTGDTVFQGTVGRCDLPGGSFSDMMASIQKIFIPMDDHLQILPGHYGPTTIGDEKKNNPYFRGDYGEFE